MTAASHQSASNRWWVWPAVVVALLLMQVGMSVAALCLAVGDPSAAVVPDFYQKAVRWDQHLAAERASDALGWSADAACSEASDIDGSRTIALTLTGRDGSPIVASSVAAVVFHHARAADAFEVRFAPTDAPGVYTATARMGRPGLWQIDVTAHHDGEATYTTSIQRTLAGTHR